MSEKTKTKPVTKPIRSYERHELLHVSSQILAAYIASGRIGRNYNQISAEAVKQAKDLLNTVGAE